MSRLSKGYLIALVATFIWSTTAIFIRYLTVRYDMPPFVLAFWRDFLLAISMGVFFALFIPQRFALPTGSWKFMIYYGLILSIFNSLWTISVRFNGAAVSTVLAYSSTAFTAILGRLFFKERLDWVKILAVIASITGCVLVSGAHDPAAWRLNPLGITTGLLSGVGFGVYSLMGKASARRGINSWTALFYSFAIAAVFIFVYTQMPLTFMETDGQPSLFWLRDSWIGWGLLFLLAIGPTLGGYGLYTFSMTILPASVANLIATLEPSLTALQSYILLSERFTAAQVAGSILIIASVIFLRVMENRRPNSY